MKCTYYNMVIFWNGIDVLGFTILFRLVYSDIVSDEEASTGHFNEEWHMDFVPTGYLPDSVYREIAWYGILQIQPLYHSTKHKVVARWIWQNTLGRPYVIMENQPQSTESQDKVSYHTVVEEAAKWSREQRAAQDVLMENIKTGGNGITVRTVISAMKTTVYIVQNGKYYECPSGSEPDLDAYRVQANMHERKCTFGKESIKIPTDPCIEAETAPLEYSFNEGWMFCLGDRGRENNYFSNGVLNCGNKSKIALDTFLDECAIDNNILITFDYFGDEPRKDLLHNTTLCTTWDPCRVSYLYRYEEIYVYYKPPLNVPAFPTTSQDPCDTTICPECLQTTEKTSDNSEKDFGWMLATAANLELVKNRVVIPGKAYTGTDVWLIRSIFKGHLLPGKMIEHTKRAFVGYEGKEHYIEDNEKVEVAYSTKSDLKWVPASNGEVPEGAIYGGHLYDKTIYICRVSLPRETSPGKLIPSTGTCYIPYYGQDYESKTYEVLCRVPTK